MPEKSSSRHKDGLIWWVMTDDLWHRGSGGRRGPRITSIAAHMQGIRGTAVADPPPLSTSCFSWLSARFCLYNTSCVWRHSSSHYTAALIKPWLWATGGNKQNSGETDRIASSALHHMRSAYQEAVPLKAFWKALAANKFTSSSRLFCYFNQVLHWKLQTSQ